MRRTLLRLLLVVPLLLPQPLSGPAFAQRSSGGYSAPRSAAPSFSSASRRPSFGGAVSGGDRAFSRSRSSEALGQYRAPAPPPSSYGQAYGDRRPSAGWANDGPVWGGARPRPSPSPAWGGGGAPMGLAQTRGSSGFLEGLMLGGLFSAFSNNGTSRAVPDQRADPGQRLAQAAPSGKPPPLPDPGNQPQAMAPQPGGGGTLVIVILFLGAGLFVLLWVWRRRRAAGPAAPASLSGSERSRFRVGMTFPYDPSPFVLAGGATRVRPPEDGNMISVEAVGELTGGGVSLHRLYLPGRQAFFLLHLGADGRPDECRYFSLLDEVTPSDATEWGAWLDPAQGMIGWPQFQTKDGRLHDRVWSPGPGRVPPRAMAETLQDLSGVKTRRLAMMLYGARTRAAAPAPRVEYVLLTAIDAPGEAYVEIHAGIDVNPASLSLPSKPL